MRSNNSKSPPATDLYNFAIKCFNCHNTFTVPKHEFEQKRVGRRGRLIYSGKCTCPTCRTFHNLTIHPASNK